MASAFLVILLGPTAIWLIEVYRAHKNPYRKVPSGFNTLRWTAVWVGDLLFISSAVAILNLWYDRVEVDSSFWTSWAFSILCLVAGIAIALLFVHLENQAGVWKDEPFNLNRLWHTPYMAWVLTLMLGATRAIGYGIIQGHERSLAVWALIMVILYFGTIVLDQLDIRPAWHAVVRRYGRVRTAVP